MERGQAVQEQDEPNETSGPLVVPLEGVLCRTDLGTEAWVQAVADDPRMALSKGNARAPLPPDALPLDTGVLDRVRQARADGRRTVLIAHGDAAQAEAVAEGLGLFDEVVCLPPQGGGPDAIAAQVGAGAEIVYATPMTSAARNRARIKALRPHQWSKNALVFLPLLAAHDISNLGAAIAAFLAFSLTASSVYILNDIADLEADRAHPRKCRRPFASGDLSVAEGLRLAAGLILGAIAIALTFAPPVFLGVLALYYAITFAYSFWLKRKLVVDVMTLAGLYTIRIVAGAAACSIALSPWMLGFSMFIFLSLAAVKRQAELVDMIAEGKGTRAGRGYVPDDLPVIRAMGLAAGYAAVLVFALYINSEEVTVLYDTPEALWLVCPILLYWISRMVMVTHRGLMTDDPIVYAATDKASLALVVAGAAIFVGAGV